MDTPELVNRVAWVVLPSHRGTDELVAFRWRDSALDRRNEYSAHSPARYHDGCRGRNDAFGCPQGVSIGIGFRIAGIEDALFWGACAAVATLIPVVGNALVWLPALVLMIVRHNVSGAIAIAVFGALMNGIIDRVVRATVSRHVGSVHPMITLVGALAGMQVAGVAGIILGPVALALFFALVETYRHEYVADVRAND